MHVSKISVVIGFGLAATVSAIFSMIDDILQIKRCRTLDCNITVQTLPKVEADRLGPMFDKAIHVAHVSKLAGGDQEARVEAWMKEVYDSTREYSDEMSKTINTYYMMLRPAFSKSDEAKRTWLMNGFEPQGPTTWLPDGIPRITNSVCYRGRMRFAKAVTWIPPGQAYLLGDMSIEGSQAVAWVDMCDVRGKVMCSQSLS